MISGFLFVGVSPFLAPLKIKGPHADDKTQTKVVSKCKDDISGCFAHCVTYLKPEVLASDGLGWFVRWNYSCLGTCPIISVRMYKITAVRPLRLFQQQ